MKGRQHLKGGQYAVLQALAAWREMEAVRADRPKRWILKDEVMIDLARRQPTHKGQLEQIRGLEPGFIKKRGDQLLQLIEQGRQLPREQWPREKAPPPRLTPNQEALTDLLQCSLRLLAREGRITHTALASRRDLERLGAGERDLGLLRGWRRALAGERLLEVLAGGLQPVVCGDGLRLRQPPLLRDRAGDALRRPIIPNPEARHGSADGAVPATGLGLIEMPVGAPDPLIHRLARIQLGDPDAGGDGMAGYHLHTADVEPQFLRHMPSLFPGGSGEQNEELLPPHPEDMVIAAQGRLDHPRQGNQHTIPGAMAIPVVDFFEMVQIKGQQC
ncbi:MAG: hypothetical protein G8D28_10400 [gamma proteobacterium symbiont of Phacoides pectinatus]